MKLFIFITFPLLTLSLSAQNRIGTGAAHQLYQQHCINCHGADLASGLGGSLLDASSWDQVGKGVSFLQYVREGNLEVGMPSFKAALSDQEIRSLEIYIDEMRQKTEREGAPAVSREGEVFESGGYRFRVETVVEGLSIPWSLHFFSPSHAIIAERPGTLRIWKDGQLSDPLQGTPEVWASGQGGLMEVTAHPDYAENGWIYLGFSAQAKDARDAETGMTKIVRGRLNGHRWVDEATIFEVPARYHSRSRVHFGTRIVFQDGYLYFSIGDRGAQNEAQDLSLPNGKIHRVHDDGRIPDDNPFVNRPGAYPSIWAYGNRNPQGIAIHPVSGLIYSSEHGPRGGDELNLIERGLNYGWPVITHGMNYNGTPITERTEAPGMEQPLLHWTPSISVCGMGFYQGEKFSDWQNDLLIGGLASQEVHRVRVDGHTIVESEIILEGEGRVRDVVTSPDGHIYLVLNGPDRVARLVRVP